MQSASVEFLAKINTQTALREMQGKVVFEQVDVTAKSDTTPTASSLNDASLVNYTIDDEDIPSKNYASFETDRWVLDGSFALAPSSGPFTQIEYVNDYLCDSTTKVFTPDVTITYPFTIDHTSVGLTIIFDTINDEYAEEFDIKYYDSSDILLETVNVTGNTDAYFIDETGVTNYRKIEIIVHKWSTGDRFVRINEVYFGIIKTYSKVLDNLMSLKNEEYLDLVSNVIKSKKLEFSVDNSDGSYDILNPTGIYQFLEAKQKIESYIGLTLDDGSIEYIKMGVFYLNYWETSEDELEAKFTAVGKLELMHQEKYYKGLKQNISLYDLAEDVILDFGYSASEFYIDPALQSIMINSYLPILTYKECLQAIAIAGECILYEDRDGKITLKQLARVDTGYTIDKDNMYINTPKIELEDLIKQVDVNTITINQDASSSEVAKSTINIDGTKDVVITYNSPAASVSAAVDIGTINSATYYTNACYLNITSTGDTVVTLTGNKLDISKNIETTSATSAVGKVVNIDVPLIDTTARALSVGAWIVDELERRRVFRPYWRQAPQLEIGDTVSIESQFTTLADVIITEQIFNFDGGLEGTSKVKG